MRLLRENVPREMKAVEAQNATIFTDACYDSSTWPCGLGGVFFPKGCEQYFSLETSAAEETIFFEAETLAAVVAFLLWSPEFVNRRCVLFVDNEGTKFSLPRGLSENKVVDFFAEKFVEAEAAIHAFT
jgi:hypothetical protein